MFFPRKGGGRDPCSCSNPSSAKETSQWCHVFKKKKQFVRFCVYGYPGCQGLFKLHPPPSITEHEKKPLVPSVVYGLKTLQCGIGWLCLRTIVLLKPEGMIKQTNKKNSDCPFYCKGLLDNTRASAIITLLVANRFPWICRIYRLGLGN